MSEHTESGRSGGVMTAIATFIVDKRSLFFLLTIIGIVFSVFSSGWVKVENDLTTYLPKDTETSIGLGIMEEQFVTYGTAQFMVANITLDEARIIADEIADLEGVQSVVFDEESSYKEVSALYTVSFNWDEDDERCVEAFERVENHLSGYDLYTSTTLGNQIGEILSSEILVIMGAAAMVVIAVLLLTSRTWAEVPVLLLTFLVAMILNMGSNFLLGEISFVSNSVTSVLQLALSLDYAVILSNRFKEERKKMPLREAVITALSKSITEISASSLTTIGGLAAMLFMQFKIGPDMAINLIKSIVFALLSVFCVMPGLLMIFGPLMDKTKHRSFIPKISFVGKFAWATRHVIPVLFLGVLLVFSRLATDCPYLYGYSDMETPKQNEFQIADEMIDNTFGSADMLALIMPTGDYETEKQLLAELEELDGIQSTMGLSNVEAMGGYMLSDKLTPRQFAELADLDYELAQVVYTAYAAQKEDYGEIISSIAAYSVPLIDILLFACDQIDSGLVALEGEQAQLLSEAQTMMLSAKEQLQGDTYNRVLIYLGDVESGQPTYDLIDTIRATAQKHYTNGDVYVVGDATSEYDFQKSFETDNVVVSVVSMLVVLVVLLFSFKSAGMPVLLILVIQGAIWINFGIPVITGNYLFFMSYLIVSAIQMGANIDYAIVIASRFNELKNEMPHRQAIIETLNFAFPTIVTSGTCLTVAGFLVGYMTSEASIAGVGQSLGRGTIISVLLVLFVLPQVLLIGSKLVDKTSFTVPGIKVKKAESSGRVRVNGMVYGEIKGTVYGSINALVDGDVNLNVMAGTAIEEGEELEVYE